MLAAGLLVVAAGGLLRLIIVHLLGPAELGIYFLAGRLTFFVAAAASEVAGAVAFPVQARVREDRDTAFRFFQLNLNALVALVATGMALLVAVAPSLVGHVLGPAWAGTTGPIRALALVSVVGLLADASDPVFKGIGEPRRMTAIEAVQTGALLLAVWILIPSLGILGAALAWLPASFLAQVLCWYFLRGAFGRETAKLARPLVALLSIGALAGAVAWLVDTAGGGSVLSLAAAVLLGSAVSLALLRLADRRLDLGFERAARRVIPGLAAPPGPSGA